MRKCFDDNEVAHCVEWPAEFDGVELSEEEKNHMESCLKCKMEVLELWEIILLTQDL